MRKQDPRARQRPSDGADRNRLRHDVEPITPDIARELELPRDRGGAIVSDVERRSPAANAGVAPGDVILEVNRQAVTSPNQVTRACRASPAGTPVFLLIWREGREMFISMTKR